MIEEDNKITIGLFNDSFYPFTDGVTLVVDNYARILCKFANVIVFVPEYKNSNFDDSTLPYKVVRSKSLKIVGLDYSLAIPSMDSKFKKELEKYKLDVVHIHSPFSMGKIGIKYAKKHNIPVVATMHSQFKRDFKRAVKLNCFSTILMNGLIKTFEKCDECWAVNKEIARMYHEDYGYSKLPGVMDNATEMKLLEDTKEARDFINNKHNLTNDEKVLLFVGRINILKNILFIVDSLKIVKDKNPNLKFKMLFVGSGNDIDKLNNHVKKLGLRKYVILCGKITDRKELASYYSRADLFLFPSLYDASSIVQLEAASQKTPTLFINGSATSSYVTNNVNGFLCENDSSKYADRIIEILTNEELLKNVSNNTYEQIYKKWDDIVDEVYKKYLTFINNK